MDNRNTKGQFTVKHKLSSHYLYKRWVLMIHRCENPTSPRYKDYGGRGIGVCERWHDINLYIEDIAKLGNRPTPNHTIDRVDNNGNYELGNIRWSTKSEQALNRRIPITNTSGVKGVTWDKQRQRWIARITYKGKREKLGRYKTLEAASLAIRKRQDV